MFWTTNLGLSNCVVENVTQLLSENFGHLTSGLAADTVCGT